MATYNGIKKIKIGDNIFNLYDSGNSGGTITQVKTTAGAHTTITVTSGAANFNVPTKTSHLTNDSGFITSYTDENVKSTTGGVSTNPFYLTGSSSSSTATGTLVKHAEIYAGHNPSGAYIAIGDSSDNYRGWINLYSSGASYCATLQPADNFTANRIITLPNKAGTIALTSDITDTKVTQTANTSAAWRKVLGTYNSGNDPTSTITSGSSNVAYYDADGPAFSTSTGELYTKGYLMYLASSDTLYTAINNLGWVSDVMI